jgi:hypothetical protein
MEEPERQVPGLAEAHPPFEHCHGLLEVTLAEEQHPQVSIRDHQTEGMIGFLGNPDSLALN